MIRRAVHRRGAVGQHARTVEGKQIAVLPRRLLRRIVKIFGKRGFVEIHRRHVEHVEPEHRLLRRIAVIVRRPARGDDEVAGRHEGLLALDRGICALAVEHEADRRGGVAMRGGDFARQDHLNAGEQRIGGAGLALQCRIFQDQDAALGLFGGDQTAGFHDQRFDVVEMPDHRLAARHRLLGDDRIHHLPQRRHVVLGDAVVIGLPDRLDIVFWVGLARLLCGSDRHGVLQRLAKLRCFDAI